MHNYVTPIPTPATTPTPIYSPTPTASPVTTPTLPPAPTLPPLPTPSPSSSPTPILTPTTEPVKKCIISGYVVDKRGNPIESAKIRLKGTNSKILRKTISDEKGLFEFTDLDADTYIITVLKKGYKRTKQTVTLGEGEDVDIEIEVTKTRKRF